MGSPHKVDISLKINISIYLTVKTVKLYIQYGVATQSGYYPEN